MRGWVSSFALAATGVLLLWVGVMQFEGAYLPETGIVTGKVARIMPAEGRYAIMFQGRDERYVLTTPNLPHPTVQALADAINVTVIYDARESAGAARAIVGLSVDGYDYFSPTTYQLFAGLLALILLLPGALMFGIGARALSPRTSRDDELDGEMREAVQAVAQTTQEALIIPFPRRPQPVGDGSCLE